MDLQRWSSVEDAANGLPATWFTPFPAQAWQRLVGGAAVTVTVRCDGPFRIMATSARGNADAVHRGSDDTVLPNVPVASSEWVWIEPDAGTSLGAVVWSIDADLVLPPVVVVVPTFRREQDATQQAGAFLGSGLVHRVVVVDQGGTLRDHAPFQALVADFPERLVLVEQGNFGGSGGYARGMLESLAYPTCAVLLSDDDAAVPEEGLRRMLVAQSLAAQNGRRLMMATPMLSAEVPETLVSASEYVDRRTFQWQAADGLGRPVSVDAPPAELSRVLRLHSTPDYAGWWGALLPPGAVADVGLPAPYFLKWDDAEFGLRATALGYEFMALPGTGVWHPTWGAWKTLTTWVAVLLHRNRLATAAAYGASRRVVIDSFTHQVKHILSLQYDVAGLWSAGIDQFLSGPGWVGTDLAEARASAQTAVDRLPTRTTTRELPATAARSGVVPGVARGVLGLFRRGRREARCPAAEFTWRDGLGLDRVVLTDGEGAAVELVADPRRARGLLARALRQHLALLWSWRSLAPRYRSALQRSVTADHWLAMLGID
ncbi:MAG: hypothetical protein ACK5LS_07850 [Propioniciclava sp.]